MSNIITKSTIRVGNIITISALIALTGCTTPRYVLTNSHGDVVQCGGSATGSLVGGMIGHEIQKSNDKKCAAEYMSRGYLPQ